MRDVVRSVTFNKRAIGGLSFKKKRLEVAKAKGDHRKRVIVVGAGFAGLEVARGLGNTRADVFLVDRQNYHLFQPLLYQVATAALSPADIAEPIRRLVRRYANISVMLEEVTAISKVDKTVAFGDGRVLRYDILVIATGATHAYFGHDDWEAFAPGLKTLADARANRSRILRAFELADMTSDAAEKARLMTFVVVGGGPSGVELAGSIAELARYTLAKDFHHIDPRSAKVLLLEAGPRILATFPEPLARYAARALARLGVTVREKTAVTGMTRESVSIAGEVISTAAIIWAAGVKASGLGRMLDVETDKAGRIKARRNLSVAGTDQIYALGDTALVEDKNGNPLPGLAQVAQQQGKHLGHALARFLQDGKEPADFLFRDRGNVAVIGRHAAVADFSWGKWTGASAWLLWALVHIYLLAGLQHRLLVGVQWAWRYFTYDRGARLIVEPLDETKKC
jgi:NADH dehydrogenase